MKDVPAFSGVFAIVALSFSLLNCAGDGTEVSASGVAENTGVGRGNGNGDDGEHLFNRPFPTGNQRACATCHVPDEDFQLSPASVEARFQQNPNDPLFRSIDANDGDRDFTNLRQHALVRVNFTLPSNIVNLDDPSERVVSVWRAVPSVFDVKFTAPYQYDRREATLQSQALGALRSHAEARFDPSTDFLDKIAAYQQTLFSTPGVEAYAAALAAGQSPTTVDDGPLTPQQQHGREIFVNRCNFCHGGPLLDQPDFVVQTRRWANIGISFFNPGNRPRLHLQMTLPNGTKRAINSPDPGIALTTGLSTDIDAFDIPSLRGSSRTAPYFHDNSMPDMRAVVEFYNRAFAASPNLTLRRIATPPAEMDDLLAYLATL